MLYDSSLVQKHVYIRFPNTKKWLELGKNALVDRYKTCCIDTQGTFTSEYRYNELCIDTKSKKCFQSRDLEANIDTHACVSIHFFQKS